MASEPTLVIDFETDAGKKFLKKLENLKKELKLTLNNDKQKKLKTLEGDQIRPFFKKIMTHSAFKELELKRVTIGNFGRRCGFTFRAIEEGFFRIFINIGDPEIYYLDNSEYQDKMLPLTNGYGFIIPSLSANSTSITVYEDPIRIINNLEIQKTIPKIRPRNYSRTTLIYDFYFNLESLDDDDDVLDKSLEN